MESRTFTSQNQESASQHTGIVVQADVVVHAYSQNVVILQVQTTYEFMNLLT